MQLREYLNIIKKRWWLAVVVALAAAAVAFGYSVLQPRIYETSVTVVGKPAKPDEGLNNFIKAELRRLPTTLRSTDTAARIDQIGKFDLGPDAILGKIKAQDRPDQFILVITVNDTDRFRAAQIANVAADFIRDANLEFVATTPDDSKVFFEKTARAPVPERPSTPRTNLNTGAGAALGLVLGLLFIFVVEFFDTKIRREEDAENSTGLKVLGVVPSWKPGSASSSLPTQRANTYGSADASGDADPASLPKIRSSQKEK